MYQRIEVRTQDGWRGPIGAINRLSREKKCPSFFGVWVGLPGTPTFGSEIRTAGRFAWTEEGWDKMGQATHALCLEAFGAKNVRIRNLSGDVLYEDHLQVAILTD